MDDAIRPAPRTVALIRASDVSPGRKLPDRWGAWTLNVDRLELSCRTSAQTRRRYFVDLERCRTSAQTLDLICQVAGKKWGTPELVGNLVHALNDLLSPQSTMCSLGINRPALTRVQIRQKTLQALAMSAAKSDG